MKWQDTSPSWRAQPMSRLQQMLIERKLDCNFDSLTVMLAHPVLEAVHAHLGRAMYEQGGLLIGEVFGDPDDKPKVRAIMVTEAIASSDFDSSAISLRMQSSIWSQASSRLDEHRLIVGWYHSHPDLGAFFSGTDRRTQAAFFAHPYSLGWVIDPIRSEQAWYLGGNSEELSPAQCRVLPE